MAMTKDNEFKWARHLNTVLLTIMTLIIGYGSFTVNALANSQNDARIEMAIIGRAILDHDEEAIKWMDRIEENEDDIEALKLEDVVATSERITKAEALDAIDDLKKYVERYYSRK